MAEPRKAANNNDLIAFKAYFDDLQLYTSLSIYKLLKQANLPDSYYYQIKEYLNGRKIFRKHIPLAIVLHLSLLYNFPFDVSKYIHLLEPLKQPGKE